MENFKKYYKFPLKVDDMRVYIRTTDYEMALMFTFGLSDDTVQDIVDKLNGESNKSIAYPLWYIKNGIEIWYDNVKIMIIRGWGMLHGNGNNCYNLPEEEAIKIQNEFAKYVVDILNS